MLADKVESRLGPSALAPLPHLGSDNRLFRAVSYPGVEPALWDLATSSTCGYWALKDCRGEVELTIS